MAKLVFLRRLQKEVEVFGGEVYFDIDGKNVGKLSLNNQVVEIPAGKHAIKMYKSHVFDTFVGFAEVVIDVNVNDQLMVKYSAPLSINQPGNIVISEYTTQNEQEVIMKKENIINGDFVDQETKKREEAENNRRGEKMFLWIIIGIIASGIISGIFYSIWLSNLW